MTSTVAPSRHVLTPEGRRKLNQDPTAFMAEYSPNLAEMKHHCMGVYQNILAGLQITEDFVDRVDHVFHTFSCPLFIFVDLKGYWRLCARRKGDYEAWAQ